MRNLLLLLGSCLLLFGHAHAQNKTVQGKITDSKGSPLPNVSIVIKGTTTGTSTQSDGSFSISVPPTARTLIISSVGFASTEVSIAKTTTVNLALVSASDKDLQDVVVVGYGTARKSDLTSSVANVGGDKVANIPFSSVDQALQGKAAGVQSTGFSGQPGANQQIRIRGVSSYSASSQPLYVVDGIQINSGDLQAATIVPSSNVLSTMNPDDIESISILKDAAATSIYGARGSNGVIIITTKKGRAGKTNISASAEVGVNKIGNFPQASTPLNGQQWIADFKEGYINAGGTPAQASTAVAGLGDSTINENWKGLITRAGTQQQYNIAASGGEGKTTFYASGGYFKQQAATIGADLTRYSALLKLDHQASRRLQLSLNLQPSYETQNGPLSNGSQFANPILDVYFLRPIQNPYNPDGSLNISPATFSAVYNPLYIVSKNVHSNGIFNGLGNAQAKLSILDNLRFTSKVGVQYTTYNQYQYDNPLHGDGKSANGRGFSDYQQYFLYDINEQLDYHAYLDKNKDLSLDAKLGYETILSKSYNITAGATNFPTTRLDLSTNASTPTGAAAAASDYSFASIYGNLILNYKDKYIISGVFRRDGSSRFSPSNKYGNFPSVGATWNISKETFMEPVTFVNNLKLRGSWGTSGNAEIGNYTWIQTFGYGGSLNYNSQPGGGFNGIGNLNLTWEKDNQGDVGIDASFLKNRLNVIIDYYDKEASRLLFANPLSQTTGFSTITQNLGKMSNKGIEFTINVTPVQTRDFSWDISFNITHNKNSMQVLPSLQPQIINGNFIVKKGYDINTWYLRQWAGVDPATGNPLWYTDSSKKTTTTSFNAAARVNTGKAANPKWYGGFSNTLTYKGFSVQADLTYNYGNYVFDQWAFYLADQINPSYGKYQLNLKRWEKPGDITNVPKAVYGSGNNSSNNSTRWLFKGDYIRLRNISVGYTIPPSIAKRMHLTSLRVYVRGTNLWTKSYDKNSTMDPEQGGSTSSNGPNSNVGLNNLNLFYNKALTAGLAIGL
ncbi:MAG TPA: TonB-dependent receptor [Puia sp.]|jgi:TonB-linked SusC/RagA family outer membrane protein|nr:TonB-dependent receptor [Puia sp.]